MKPQTERAIQLAAKAKLVDGEEIRRAITERFGHEEATRFVRLVEGRSHVNIQEICSSEGGKWAWPRLQRLTALLDWKALGFPLVCLAIEAAEELAATDPPAWLLTSPHGEDEYDVMGLEVGDHFGLVVNWRYGTCLWPHECGGPPPFEADQHRLMLANVGFALQERPEGLDIRTPKRPSRKALRARGIRHYPSVEYIIQAPRLLHPEPTGVERGPREEGWTQSVRTTVRGHFRQQAHGPHHSLRKPIWIRPHERGPEDAPVSVHPMKLETEQKS